MGSATKKASDKTLKVVGRKYASVAELVRDTAEPEVANEFDQYQADRKMVNSLTTMRCVQGISQAELAQRMDCGQSKVSKIETSVDADLNFGDIIKYAQALRQATRIVFSPARRNRADHIRFHIASIKLELDHLVRIAGNDQAICNGIESYAIDTMKRMVDVIEESLKQLPHCIQQEGEVVSVEAEGARGQRLSLDAPNRRTRGKSAKKVVASD